MSKVCTDNLNLIRELLYYGELKIQKENEKNKSH